MERITSTIIDTFIKEIKKKENMDKMRTELINPIIHHTFKRLYPYIVVVSIIFVATFILAFAILLFNVKIHYK
jgi:hypothetical protein